MKFKCELQMKDGRIIIAIIFAEHLQSLSEQLLSKYPNCKLLSAIGGEV